MDYAMNREAISIRDVVFDDCQEQPIDIDLTLPDYCPDIQKIMKCQVYPRVTMHNISGDRLEVDGVALIRILYLESSKKTIRCSEHTAPFSCSFNLKTTPQNAVVITTTKPEYINCRALSPRRLDIHGAFSVYAQIICKNDQNYVKSINAEDVQQKTLPVSTVSLAGLGQQQFTVTESLEIGQGKPAVQSIIRSDVKTNLTDCKSISNKLMLKGDIILRILYSTDLETGMLDYADFNIPFSQMLDVDGVSDECICDTGIDVLNYEIKIRNDIGDDDTILEFDAKLLATSLAYTNTEIQLVENAYSTQYEIELTHKQIQLTKTIQFINENVLNKATLDLNSQNISKIIDIWNENSTVNADCEEDQITFTGKYNVCILALDEEENPFYIERSVDFNYQYQLKQNLMGCNVRAKSTVMSLSYRINNSNDLEIRTDIRLSGTVFDNKLYKAVFEAYANEEHPRIKDSTAALTLYYADNGESIWNIADNYCTSVEAIKNENDLDVDILDTRGMLLIPM